MQSAQLWNLHLSQFGIFLTEIPRFANSIHEHQDFNIKKEKSKRKKSENPENENDNEKDEESEIEENDIKKLGSTIHMID